MVKNLVTVFLFFLEHTIEEEQAVTAFVHMQVTYLETAYVC